MKGYTSAVVGNVRKRPNWMNSTWLITENTMISRYYIIFEIFTYLTKQSFFMKQTLGMLVSQVLIYFA